MKCKNCRGKITETSRYCPECGYPVDEKYLVTREDFLRDTVNKGPSDRLSPDTSEKLIQLEHQGHLYYWDESCMGVWVDKSILDEVSLEAAQIVFENLNPTDQKYFNQAKEHIKLKASGMKSPVSGQELDEHYYKALVIDQDYETGGLWIDSNGIALCYAASQNKAAPALTPVEELLHILVHLKFFED